MRLEGILTNIKLVISFISSIAILLKLILQLTGFNRENSFKSTIMFHKVVYEHHRRIYNEIYTMFEWPGIDIIVNFLLKIIMGIVAVMIFIALVVVMIVRFDYTTIPPIFVKYGHILVKYSHYCYIFIVATIIIAIAIKKSKKENNKEKSGSISLILANIIIPVSILGAILFYPMFTPQTSSSPVCNSTIHFQLSTTTLKNDTIMLIQNVTSNETSVIALKILRDKSNISTCTANLSIETNSSCRLCLYHYLRERHYGITEVIVAFTLEILWLLMFSRGMLITKYRELEILQDENSIKNAVFGLMNTLVLSGAIVVFWILKLSSLETSYYYLQVITATSGVVILTYLISNTKETAVRLLWKAKVRDFADNLPYLIVKTKTGNIYYGQLYDPLDNKVLVLRKSKLILEDKNDLISSTSGESAGDYWIISWKDVESIKIIEEGLYEPPKQPTNNPSSQSTDNDFKEEKSRKNTETDSKPKT